jgi:hypothetical protein
MQGQFEVEVVLDPGLNVDTWIMGNDGRPQALVLDAWRDGDEVRYKAERDGIEIKGVMWTRLHGDAVYSDEALDRIASAAIGKKVVLR